MPGNFSIISFLLRVFIQNLVSVQSLKALPSEKNYTLNRASFILGHLGSLTEGEGNEDGEEDFPDATEEIDMLALAPWE